jgi:vacuolar-type H+-ATPase subunit E/Vma4
MKNVFGLVKTAAFVVIAAVLPLAVSFVAYRANEETARGVGEMYGASARPVRWILEAKACAIQSRRLSSATLDMRLSEIRESEALVGQYRKKTDSLFVQWQEAPTTDRGQSLFSSLQKIRENVESLEDVIIAVAKAQRRFDMNQAAARLKSDGDIAQAEAQYMEAFDALAEHLSASADEMNAAVTLNAARAGKRILYAAAAAILMSVVLGIVMAKGGLNLPARNE